MSDKWATGSDKKRAAKLAEAEGITKGAALRIVLERKGKELPVQYKRDMKNNSRKRRRKAVTCERKQAYKTFVSASIARKKIIIAKELTEDQAKRLEIYICEVCKNLHVGSVNPPPK